MKKIISIFCIAIMAINLTVPCSATSFDESSNSVVESEIYIEDYMVFYNNQQYYKDLVEQGYTIIVNVGKEYAELEESRIASESAEMDELTESMARGTSIPTSRWNISTQGKYNFSGSAAYSILYLGYLIYGHDGYGATVYNKSESNILTVNAHGCRSERSFSLDPLTSRLEKFSMYSASDNFYLSFNAPYTILTRKLKLTSWSGIDGKRNSINAEKCCDKAKEIVRNKNVQKSSEFPFLRSSKIAVNPK